MTKLTGDESLFTFTLKDGRIDIGATMPIRLKLAESAMQGIIACPHSDSISVLPNTPIEKAIAVASLKIADALLAEYNKGMPHEQPPADRNTSNKGASDER